MQPFFKKTFLSLRNRNFRLYFFGQLVSNTGNWLTNVALTLLVLHITGSGLDVGLLAAFQYGPILFLSAWAGAIADRSDKRTILIATQTLEMLQSCGLAVLAFMPHPPLVGLYVLALFGGVFLAFDNPLRRSFVSEMVPRADVPNAVAIYSTVVNSSRIVGPALAGALVVAVGYGWCFSIDAASYLTVLAGLFMMRPAELLRQDPRRRQKGEIREGVRYVFAHSELWISFAMLAAIGALSYNFSVTLPLFVIDSLRGSTVVFTILYSVYSAGAVACSLLIAHRSRVRVREIIFGAAALGIAMLALSATPDIGAAFVVAFFVGMASILYTNSTTTLVQLETDANMRGRVLALQTILIMGTTPIGGPLLGWLADVAGARVPILLGGAVCIGAAAFGYAAARSRDLIDVPAAR